MKPARTMIRARQLAAACWLVPTMAFAQIVTFEDLPRPPQVNSFASLADANAGGGGSTLVGVTFDQALFVCGNDYVELFQNTGGTNRFLKSHTGRYAVFNANAVDRLMLTTQRTLLGIWFARPDFGGGVGGATSVTVRAFQGVSQLGAVTMVLAGTEMKWMDTSVFTNFPAITAYRIDRMATGQGPYAGGHYLADDFTFADDLRPRLSIQRSPTQTVQICWLTVTNKDYQIQYRSDLSTNVWIDLGEPASGTGLTNCITDLIPVSQKRLYRAVVLP